MTIRAAALAAVAALATAAPAEAAFVPRLPPQCRANASQIHQEDPVAPLVVGDSVTVAAGKYLAQEGFTVDAIACRMWGHGLQVLNRRRLPDLVVVALGSNGDTTPADLEQALEVVGPFARLVLVLPKELGGAPDPDGRLMRSFERAHSDQVMTLDWPAYSAGQSGWFAPDGLHLTTPGAQGFARMISEGVAFGPAEQVERPPVDELSDAPKPRPHRRPPRRPDPALAAMWHVLTDAVGAIFAPGLRFLARFVTSSGDLGPQDL